MMKHMKLRLKFSGFQGNDSIPSSHDVKYELYWRAQNEVPHPQISATMLSKMYFKPHLKHFTSQHTSAEIYKKAVSGAKEWIMEYKENNYFGKVKLRDGIDTAIGCIQRFKNSYHVPLSAGPFMFYPPLYLFSWFFIEAGQRSHQIRAVRTCISSGIVCDDKYIFFQRSRRTL